MAPSRRTSLPLPPAQGERPGRLRGHCGSSVSSIATTRPSLAGARVRSGTHNSRLPRLRAQVLAPGWLAPRRPRSCGPSPLHKHARHWRERECESATGERPIWVARRSCRRPNGEDRRTASERDHCALSGCPAHAVGIRGLVRPLALSVVRVVLGRGSDEVMLHCTARQASTIPPVGPRRGVARSHPRGALRACRCG